MEKISEVKYWICNRCSYLCYSKFTECPNCDTYEVKTFILSGTKLPSAIVKITDIT